MIETRRSLLLQELDRKGEMELDELHEFMPDVSLMTIRRDLISLENEGKVIRVRGGARSRKINAVISEPAYNQRLQSHDQAKMEIAKKAQQLVSPGRSIYIDSGTTCLAFARELPDDNLFVITPSPHVALELAKRQSIKVNLTGGQLNRDTQTLTGTNAANYVKGINIDFAFIASSAFSLQHGFSCGDFDEAELKRLIIKKAQFVVVLMDQSKLGFSMPYTFAQLSNINALICDNTLPDNYLKSLRRSQVRLF
ncbi:MAG TPA: DeoR/GlpR family DNA-binding transcription regulator [Clostridia bacterium]|nr:DeoR/GlpR family DNA-binding transcription regulator [Clostridia bacterium]